MSTHRAATVNITNNSGGNARILLFHKNSIFGTQSDSWAASPGQTVGSLPVFFETVFGINLTPDYWSVLLHVLDGPAPGLYFSQGPELDPLWQECQLKDDDADQTLTFSVSTEEFYVARTSDGCTGEMTRLTPSAPITHVFVVMLENRSFDSMFAMSGIKGITAATTSDSNSYNGETYYVQSPAPLSLPTDPGHEFPDAVHQLCGANVTYPPGGPFPPIDNSGFVANYATTLSEGTGLPPPADFGDVLKCFATPIQLPVLYQLATEFALCDRWHSSLPGLTWPNRFFVHGASSSGMDANPSNTQIGEWEIPGEGFTYPNGSIYDALNEANIPHRFYRDSDAWGYSLYSDAPQNGSPLGAVPQVSSLSGVSLTEDVFSLRQFASDLQSPYPYPYTFIEPHYGEVVDDTYQGGSSQHPMDDVYGGEHLLASVYAAIRKSPYWDTSLLVITYDEHGGLYDSVAPGVATPPGDNPPPGYNVNGFNFEQYGVRVPAIVVSPLVPSGTVDHTLYDHSSVLKTLEELFGLQPLTHRDAAANNVLHLLSLATPRTDCPTSLNSPAPLSKAARARPTAQERALSDAQPLPESGNAVGALQNLLKAEIELSGRTPPEMATIKARFEAIRTRGHARAYADSVMEKIRIAREQRELALQRKP
jgi:phospholipase C